MDLTLDNRQIVPAVINFFQFENQTTTLTFTLDSYMYGEVDLRNYQAYAVTSIKGVVDMCELEQREVDGKLVLTWNVGDYTLKESGAITYQITFKENMNDGENSAVWYSYKAIMINRGSVDADYKITAEYPTIMKQWLDRMNDLTVPIIYIPYNETIPVEDRIDGRLYFQWLDENQTKGMFEDPNGVHLVIDGNGGNIVPDNNGGISLPMFATIWSDHLYNDVSFLRANTFSWHNANIYVGAYNTLLNEYNNGVEETDENGVTYKLSPNGFKIANVSQEETIINLYQTSGVAWYYIIDIENSRFKLPRTELDETNQIYLYFFVGGYEREEAEINIGALTEIVNEIDLEAIVDEINEAKEQAIADIHQQPITNLAGNNGTVALEVNKVYTMEINTNTTFSLPTGVNTNYFNQIKVMAKIIGTPQITWGTTYFMNKSTPELEEGCYDFYFDYDNHLSGWVVGVVSKGLAE